ncbi:hypothetical protein [Catenulispora pinisilvae]|uniref:hypothetical protein n=1 Tax=Catenulispora pinisilvae TaxID=2705253 RepID=UPI0018910020|nr:hypothetical protein [Catenulispora pinisilvae]
MAESGKTATLKRVMEEGHTGGYGTLLHLTAILWLGPEAFYSTYGEELTEWCGHFKGLKAALLCLAMYERQLGPEEAAMAVDRHIEAAMDDLEHRDGAKSGSMR